MEANLAQRSIIPNASHVMAVSCPRSSGQKLCFVGRDVDICWTFGFARFARKTQVERSLHWLAAPTISDYFALKHLKEHVRTPRVLCSSSSVTM